MAALSITETEKAIHDLQNQRPGKCLTRIAFTIGTISLHI